MFCFFFDAFVLMSWFFTIGQWKPVFLWRKSTQNPCVSKRSYQRSPRARSHHLCPELPCGESWWMENKNSSNSSTKTWYWLIFVCWKCMKMFEIYFISFCFGVQMLKIRLKIMICFCKKNILHNSMMMTLTMMIHDYDVDFARNMFTICKGKEAQSQEPSYASISKMIFTASLSLRNIPASPAHQTMSFGRLILRNDCDISPTYGKGSPLNQPRGGFPGHFIKAIFL